MIKATKTSQDFKPGLTLEWEELRKDCLGPALQKASQLEAGREGHVSQSVSLPPDESTT